MDGSQFKASSYLYEENGIWHPLPQWSEFFISLGNYIAEFGDYHQRLVIAVAVPSRLYAASLTAFGIVAKNATVPSLNPQMYFRQLCDLRVGTPLTYIKDERKLKAIFEGSKDITEGSRTEKRVSVRVESHRRGGLTHLVSMSEAHNVRLRPNAVVKLPDRQNGHRFSTHSKLLEACLGQDGVPTYLSVSRLDCLVIGNISLLKTEITQTQFACMRSSEGCRNSGTLQDILGVRSFLSTTDQTFHSEVISSIAQSNNSLPKNMRPCATVFDGGYSFIRWNADYTDSHWIVILDRTEPHFREAVELINQHFLNRLESRELCSPPPAPAGVELIAYRQEF